MSKTPKKYFLLSGIIIFAILITSIIVYILMPRGNTVKLPETNELFSVVREGDIICRLGDRLWSQLFKDISVNDRRYSHLGIIHINNDQINVIHSEGTTRSGKDFVKEEPLGDFLEVARAIGIYRINDIDGNEISKLAKKYIGMPFDWQFDLQDESKLYCTELLYAVLKQVKPELELETVYVKELGKNIIPLESISNSIHFSEIYFFAAGHSQSVTQPNDMTQESEKLSSSSSIPQ